MKNIKKIISYTALALFTGIAIVSCNILDNDDYEEYLKQLEEYQKQIREQYQTDSTLIVEYLTANDSVADYHEESGIFYHILEEGGTEHPITSSIIRVTYKGMLLDGTVFDQTAEDVSTNTFYLEQLISGWQYGVPLIGEEGRIILYLPSYYGFGSNESDDIPANSVLIFDINLISFI